MIGAFEGDLIRPLGLVTLYFAYAEGEVDELLAVLNARQSCPMSTLNWTVGQKISRALLLIEELAAPNLNDLVERLKELQELAGSRNQLIHGRLFNGDGGLGTLISSNSNIPNTRVSAADIEQLADRIFTCKEYLSMHRCRHLLPALGKGEPPSGT